MTIDSELVEVNGVTLRVHHMGEGPLVVLLHGFPELAHSWRHQIPALAAAGYRVIAPDQRGYGDSSRPETVEEYDIFHLVGDVVALAEYYGDPAPAVVGHDWGSFVAWQCALFRPDLFRGVMAMSVPYLPRGPMSLIDLLRATMGDAFHYILYFQEPHRAEAELDADPGSTLRQVMWSVAGDRPATMHGADPGSQTRLLEATGVPQELPGWLDSSDFEVYVDAFTRSGFGGGVNWYRNFQRNYDLTRPWHQARISIPSAFVGGLSDFVVNGGVVGQAGPGIALMESMCDDHRGTVLLEGIGHWNQQEAPEETNQALLAFLGGLA